MFTQNVETIEPFSSCMALVKVGRAYIGECINVMVEVLWTEDGSLPHGLTVQNTYTELRQGSKKAVVVVRNSMAYLHTLQKRTQNHLKRPSCRRGWTSPRVPIIPD